MRRFALALGALAAMSGPGFAQSETWEALSGAEIAEVLTGIVLDYVGAWQDFRASGRTLYNAGEDSWGYWAVRGNQYCSQWPPSGLWDCYDVAQSGDDIVFIGRAGDRTVGTIRR